MQESWGSFSDRVSRLGWEGATNRPMAWRSPWRHLDVTLVLAALGLAALGSAAVYSATVHELRAQGLDGDQMITRHLVHLAIAVVAMLSISLVDYRKLQAWAGVVYGVCVLVLALVLSPAGHSALGAQRAFDLGAFQFQPTEFAKIGVIVALAAVFGMTRDPPNLRQLLMALGALALVGVEVLLQPDFGTFIVFVAILFGVLLVSGVQARWLVALTLIGTLGVVGMFQLDVLKEYQKQRLTAFINPDADPDGRDFTWNYRQALTAVGAGGVTGKGYLQGSQTNLGYVPEQHTDFIFTVIAEELGFMGAALLLSLYALVVWRALRIAALARDQFGTLLAVGILSMLTFQAFVNVGMTLGLMPITGIPLQFVSYGGSSLIATFTATGLLLNVHMRRFL